MIPVALNCDFRSTCHTLALLSFFLSLYLYISIYKLGLFVLLVLLQMNNPNNSQPKDYAEEESSSSATSAALEPSNGPTDKAETVAEEDTGTPMALSEKEPVASTDDPMEVESVNPATVFCIRLKQPRSNLLHKMSVPELCRNFRLLLLLLLLFEFLVQTVFFFRNYSLMRLFSYYVELQWL